MIWMLLIILVTMTTAHEMPSCHVQLTQGKIEKPCAEIKTGNLTGHWQSQRLHVTEVFSEGGRQYVNVTMKYRYGKDLNLPVALQESDMCDDCWILVPLRDTTNSPALISVTYLPVSDSFKELVARKYLYEEMLFPKDPSNTTIQECAILNTSRISFRARPKTRSIEMSLKIDYELELDVQLYSGGCSITCCGGMSDCEILLVNRTLLWNVSELLYVAELSPSYYCARINLKGKPMYCNMCTPTLLLMKDPGDAEIPYVLPKEYFFPAAFFGFATFVTVTFVTVKFSRGKKHKCWPYAEVACQEGSPENLIRLQEASDRFEDEAESLIPVEIFLLYSRDSEPFQKLMNSFRKILAKYCKKVWDPLEEKEMEAVSSNVSAWVEGVMRRQDLRIILVETQGSIEKQEAWITNPSGFLQHHLDHAFLYTISCLHDNPFLCHDYKKLFIVRFDTLPENKKLSNIVSCTRYQMPDHLSSLSADLSGSVCGNNEAASKIHNKERLKLEMIVQDYKNSLCSN